MVATQVQRRRGTSTQAQAMTPAEGEIIVDLTNDTLRVGDGARAGGWIMPNFNHLQTQSMQYASAGGSANAITLAINPAPASYVQGLKLSFRATANNTGSTTINVNGLGAVTLQKVTGNTVSNLDSGDIVSGAIYEIVYNGTTFQLTTNYKSGLVSIGQGDLRTSIGSVSASGGLVTLPGGQYGFSPLVSRVQTANYAIAYYANNNTTLSSRLVLGAVYGFGAVNVGIIRVPSNGYATLGFGPGNDTNITSATAQQRYVTSSPPYDLGNGDVGGFIFLLQDSNGDIISSYAADTPPWAYNGPTDIRATHKCPVTGKKYRTVCKKMSVEQIIDGCAIEYEQQEITHEIKNSDMSIIPHPFDDVSDGKRVILLDPMSDKTERLITLINNGGSEEVNEIINGGYLKIDNSNIRRGCHKSVKACKFGYKNNG